ncbi:MAG: hypothetical protein ACETWQ_18715 [Phycisphaerae bacterium]
MNGNIWIIIGIIFGAIAAFSLPYGFYLKSQENSRLSIDYLKTFLDNENKELDNFEQVKVLNDDIVNAQRGYMRIKVSKDYLNESFKSPVTLKYTHGKYQPIMLTFKDHEEFGAGVIFVSPERDRKAEIYLNQCFRFKGFGKMYYTEDLIFEFYYNDYCVYFVTNSAEIRFERQLPPIRYGRNICIGYFDQNNKARNKNASADFPRLENFFKKRIEEKNTLTSQSN